MCTKLLQLCLTLCNSVHCSQPGSSVHRIMQAVILEWVAMSSSKGSSPLRDQTHISSPALAGMFCTTSATWEVPLTSCKSFYSISRMRYLQLSYIEVFDWYTHQILRGDPKGNFRSRQHILSSPYQHFYSVLFSARVFPHLLQVIPRYFTFLMLLVRHFF